MMGLPSCRDVTRAISTDSVEEAAFRQRLAIRMHLLLCHHCRRYARQLRAIGLAARRVFSHPRGEAERLERVRRSILERLEPPH